MRAAPPWGCPDWRSLSPYIKHHYHWLAHHYGSEGLHEHCVCTMGLLRGRARALAGRAGVRARWPGAEQQGGGEEGARESGREPEGLGMCAHGT